MSDPSLSPEHERLVRKLRTLGELSAADVQAIGTLPMRQKTYSPDQVIVREGDQPDVCGLIVEGLVHRYKDLPQGSRQIMSFHIPGDVPDLLSLHLHRLDHSLGAVTPTKMAFIPHEAMRDVCRTSPHLGSLFWRDTLIDGSIFREWLINLGRRPAYARIAHLICELMVRFRSVGLADDRGFELPLTQAELGDAVGLSTVHVNRVLQELRREGLIETKGRLFRAPDWEGLKQAAGFEPSYLHLSAEAAAAAQ